MTSHDNPTHSLQSSFTVATITEVPPVAFLPNRLVQSLLLSKFRLQTGGTILVSGLLGGIVCTYLGMHRHLYTGIYTWAFIHGHLYTGIS